MSINQLPDYFRAERLTPVNFYGYLSSPNDRVFEITANSSFDRDKYREEITRFHDLKRRCESMEVDASGVKAVSPIWTKLMWDDKITIECITEEGKTIYVGYWGCTFCIGMSINARDRRPQKLRQVEVTEGA